ncbi:MAG: VOC family protein [Candidatus Zixiibacteriota bacterium]|jgi:predicted enzyme related to lactoylglutathione lyase|nr:MAG: VOC family protein [candidate division Zixibacteria bacterium]
MTRDVPAAAKFYSELLGWEPADSGMPGMAYTIFKAADKDAGGMMEMPKDIPEQVPSHWMSYIAVSDIDAIVGKTPELGGTVLHGPQEVPGVGRFAVIQDPTGAVVSLIQ